MNSMNSAVNLTVQIQLQIQYTELKRFILLLLLINLYKFYIIQMINFFLIPYTLNS